MPDVVIYTKSWCSYCQRAMDLLRRKGVEYTELEVSRDDALEAEMVSRAGGRRTVPQIFIGSAHVGGCDDLHRLEAEGRLDALLR
ncbi:glutaredoxin 3 [Tautonia plasticadhaerens]|uniref:Glutaredoxin n=1 Tax=Tautonia plasticadhaerens TaxID=2527974 RepID=A0A518H0F5_9BACT|nr:glutaredoxin 3 [Tautonia plasticadhaerens]QDV34324.1 Glutaredoxin-3 [Tautonia plasticadhaerens]